ncbi:hypothetical protein [Mycetocola spongiae]|uniref:hypothetical protein n=1 Tax=Mycetocola spongiae TaxID=2859226 RepID=UPI001CF2E082|nr:hypothetical protein [Mycetocola spongiae]UCR89319.1 hypothetical protein KXZ72_01000 [Mycetocola spongiae]
MRRRLGVGLYTILGCALFLLAGFFLVSGRFGPGVLLMAAAAVFLGTASAADRRRRRAARDRAGS